MVRLIPKSKATMRRSAAPRRQRPSYGESHVTSATRSMPSVPGSAEAALRNDASSALPNAPGHCTGVAQYSCQPTSVDPADRADPVVAEHLHRAHCSERWLLWRRAISRTITPRQNGRCDSKSVALVP